ncbi:MAG: hypothetical protein U0835_22350 [Isosphaeraceae bacterium]
MNFAASVCWFTVPRDTPRDRLRKAGEHPLVRAARPVSKVAVGSSVFAGLARRDVLGCPATRPTALSRFASSNFGAISADLGEPGLEGVRIVKTAASPSRQAWNSSGFEQKVGRRLAAGGHGTVRRDRSGASTRVDSIARAGPAPRLGSAGRALLPPERVVSAFIKEKEPTCELQRQVGPFG